MIADEIKRLLEAMPFVPFVIHMRYRPPIKVPHPDFAHVAPNRRTVVVWPEDGRGSVTLNATQISQIEQQEQRQS